MDGFIILSAFLLDLLAGDPRWLPHPVRIIGLLIGSAEKGLRRIATNPRAEKAAGVLLVIIVVLPVYVLSLSALSTALGMSVVFGIVFAVLMAYTTLSTRGLADAARAVLLRLDRGDIRGARSELAMIVGRDTDTLDEEDIIRAVIESVAENTSDGVVAPLFYLALGGPALAMAYKAVNTLDSMVGYRSRSYRHFGWAAAKLDDLANYIPARITAVVLCLSAWPVVGSGPGAWKATVRDGRKHLSPNSGYPEAAMAGALGIRLGGESAYSGMVHKKPYLGDDYRHPDKKDIAKSVQLLYCCALLAALCAAGIRAHL